MPSEYPAATATHKAAERPRIIFCASLVSNSKSALCWATSGLQLLHRINKCVAITEWYKEPQADSDSQDSSKTLFTNSELTNKFSTTAVWMWRSGQAGKLTESLQCLACFSQSRWKARCRAQNPMWTKTTRWSSSKTEKWKAANQRIPARGGKCHTQRKQILKTFRLSEPQHFHKNKLSKSRSIRQWHTGVMTQLLQPLATPAGNPNHTSPWELGRNQESGGRKPQLNL